ncbi:hypothetical protein FGADI_7340 [Fusarium gaditjirri]|uniref:Glyoxalase-like domain-containing protein n=1 Tax=Fusarium gaditjirri TaxID=282569 RepID=A0A8H4T585_9HYPO|nr:hypothetical protein FGADI_7340 [Fusarium gaditjirri]
MAEAFGIAGSAIGVVSLGLQLFKEISQYLDDIDGREEDLKQARNFAKNIQVSIDALDVAIANTSTDDPTTKNAMDSCRNSCISAANSLFAFVKQLRGPIISVPNSNAARAKELCAKLKYPFKKQNIEKLEENLSRTNSALQTMLQVFQLNSGHATTSAINSMHQALVGVKAISEMNKVALDEVHKTSQLHDERLSTIQQDVRELLILTREPEDSRLLLRTIAQQISDLTSQANGAANLLQNPTSDTFIPNLRTTRYQGGGSMTFDSFCSCKTQRIRYSQRQWGPLLLESEVRSRDHHAPECPMSKLPASTRRTKRVLSLMIPTSQGLWGRASRVSLSFTTGAGVLGIGQSMTWIATVDERLSPVFRLVDTIAWYEYLPRKDMHILLASCFRRLVWCYANYHASVTDVNKDGDTLLESALENYPVSSGYDPLTADNVAELFQMLTAFAKPTSCTRKITAEPVGHHVNDWGLTWWRDKDRVGAGYRLLQAFPQVVENLEFGPLSQAVLQQDRNGVQQLLEKFPSYINETNYCGQSPIHLAIETQNIAVISVVLRHADPKALSARDNRGYYPIDYATERTWKHIEGAQADCDGCKVLEMLLRLGTALVPTSLRLAERREELKELSYQKLSPAQRKGLEIHQTRILDQNAAQVQHQLEAQGCPIPMHVSVYKEDIGSSYDHQSIYALILNGEVAEYAHQLGFYYSDNEFANFIRSLAFHMNADTEYESSRIKHPFSSSYLCWMIEHGTSVSSRIPAGQLPNSDIEVTAAHYFMASLGISNSRREQNLALDCPLSLAAIEILFSEAIVDKCSCWCSPGGCSPLIKLLEGISWWKRPPYESEKTLSQTIERLITGLFLAHWGKISDYQWIYATISTHRVRRKPSPRREPRGVLRMDAHELGLRMKKLRKELASQRLTDKQLRDAESIGVVWEVYGPQPTEQESDYPEWGQDHIVILVSYQTLQELPKRLESVLTVIDGGAHADGRTVNKLIEFSDGVYIELIAFQDDLDPEKRKTHRWGELEENTLVDWAYTLRNGNDFGVIRQRVSEATSEIFYNLPVAGGRIRPDGVELKWSVASAYATSGKAVHPGKAPFWCLDDTPRHLRVPYKKEDGSDPSYTKHPSGAIGVSGVSISVPEEEHHVITRVYDGIHGSTTEEGTWPFVVHSGSTKGKQEIALKISQDQERHIHLTLLGDENSPESIEILPGLKFSFES